MKESVYIETSIISYLCSRPSRDLVIAANQELVHEWWHGRRTNYECFISEFVIQEIAAGDPEAAERRRAAVDGIAVLAATEEGRSIEKALMAKCDLPARVATDVAHVALASAQAVDYLLTLNCSHIANAHLARRFRAVIEEMGYQMPVLCTPQEIMEEYRQ